MVDENTRGEDRQRAAADGTGQMSRESNGHAPRMSADDRANDRGRATGSGAGQTPPKPDTIKR